MRLLPLKQDSPVMSVNTEVVFHLCIIGPPACRPTLRQRLLTDPGRYTGIDHPALKERYAGPDKYITT